MARAAAQIEAAGLLARAAGRRGAGGQGGARRARAALVREVDLEPYTADPARGIHGDGEEPMGGKWTRGKPRGVRRRIECEGALAPGSHAAPIDDHVHPYGRPRGRPGEKDVPLQLDAVHGRIDGQFPSAEEPPDDTRQRGRDANSGSPHRLH